MKSELLTALLERSFVDEMRVSDAEKLSKPLMKKINNRVLSYTERHRGVWFKPEYDLSEIQIAQDTDSYLFRAIKKKTNRFLIAGWDIVGNDPEVVTYIKKRIREIEYVSKKPWDILLTETAQDLFRFSNCMWVKVRNKNSSSGKVIKTFTGSVEPVAGYFILPFETISFKTKRNGDIKKVRQKTPTGEMKEFNPKDVVHFYDNKKPGFAMGTPELIPVLDDISLLRRLEENIEALIESNLYPLFHYKIGSDNFPERYSPDGIKETDIVKNTIDYMPAGGIYVSDHRHKIESIGSEGRALRIEGYLTYFKARVFAGLGISSVDMGEGDTANRSTANTLSKSAIQDVEALQKVLKIFIEFFVFDELLIEGGYDPISEKNKVEIKFGVVDDEVRSKLENQTVQLWLNKLITEKEARKRLGMSPDVLYEETYFAKYEEKLASLKSSGGPDSGPENKSESIANPENQHGNRGAPKLNSDNIDSYLYEKRNEIKEKYKKSFISNEKLDTILNNFIYNSSIEIKNMLKKLDSDLQCSISSNMMVENIIEIVEICKKDTIEELEMVLNIKG